MRFSMLSPVRSALALGLVATLALAPACSDDGSTSAAPGAAAGSGGSSAVPGSDLDGTWETACYQKTKTTLTYDHLDLVGTYTEFDDDACTSPIHVSTWTGTGSITGATAADDTKLDLAFTSFTSTALTPDNAAFNSMNAYCGFTDWQAEVPKDVLGKDCYGFSIPVGGESRDIYRVTGDTLRFGQGAAIGTDLSEEDRPTAIDDARVFARQ